MSNNTNVLTDDEVEERFPRAEVIVVALTFFSLILCGICSLVYCCALLREKEALVAEEEEENAAAQKIEEERIKKRKEAISKGLNVKEWVPNGFPVEKAAPEEDQSTPAPLQETVEVPQPPALPVNSSPASCGMGSDECESSGGEEEEMAGCAICLSEFKPQQLVCESNNSSCQHVFHKDCMVDWLMKHHDDCPMCREVYLKTV